jgi:replicative superfamily II helicase
MARPSHPNKEIEAVVSEAENEGWTWQKVKGHAWGQILCAHHDRDGCRISIWSTPKNAENHAKQVRRAVNRCPHKEEVTDEDV